MSTNEQVGEEVLLHRRVAGDADDQCGEELADPRRAPTDGNLLVVRLNRMDLAKSFHRTR